MFQTISLDDDQLLALMASVLLTAEGESQPDPKSGAMKYSLPDSRCGAIADMVDYARQILAEVKHQQHKEP